MSFIHKITALMLTAAATVGHGIGASPCRAENDTTPKTGSVVFIHPDGTSVSAWAALRLLDKGPDGHLNWDKMQEMGVYRGHLRNSLAASSHGGATTHAYGTKAAFDSYGSNPMLPVKALSGAEHSIMIEARNAGLSIGTINSGQIAEPGTGVFLASAYARAATDFITKQIVESGADIVMAGGEERLLPEGVIGRHGVKGIRKDGKNLIEKAQQLGYTVVYTRDQLKALPSDTEKVLGIFSAGHTFNQATEEYLKEKELPLYKETAPSVAEMTEVALRILAHKGKNFLLVVEEEGTDNFGNRNNAKGTLEALRRADAAIGVVMGYMEEHPNTLILTAADSNAGGMNIVALHNPEQFEKPLPATVENGAPLDGRDGTGTLPFLSGQDQFGTQMGFGIAWGGKNDFAGGIVARAHGLNAERLPNSVDNTVIYRMVYLTLFGKWLE